VVERLDKPSSYVEARAKYRVLPLFSNLLLTACVVRQRIPRPHIARNNINSLRRKSILLHNRRTDTRTLLKVSVLIEARLTFRCGEVKRIIMGLDRFQKTPCGFCFVEYQTHQQAVDCMRFINGTKLDERLVRTDLDPGFKEGRQYGRGRSGGQVYFTFNFCVNRRFAMNTEKIMIPHGEDGENSAQSSK